MNGTLQAIGSVTGSLSATGGLSGALSGSADVSGGLSVPQAYERPYVLPPATTSTLGGVIVGDHLEVTEEGVLSVTVVNSAEHDNTNPISAAAVYTEVGNINALLATI